MQGFLQVEKPGGVEAPKKSRGQMPKIHFCAEDKETHETLCDDLMTACLHHMVVMQQIQSKIFMTNLI